MSDNEYNSEENESEEYEEDESQEEESVSTVNPSFIDSRELSMATIYSLMPLVEKVKHFDYDGNGWAVFEGILKENFNGVKAGKKVNFSASEDKVTMWVYKPDEGAEEEEDPDFMDLWKNVGSFRVLLQPPVIVNSKNKL